VGFSKVIFDGLIHFPRAETRIASLRSMPKSSRYYLILVKVPVVIYLVGQSCSEKTPPLFWTWLRRVRRVCKANLAEDSLTRRRSQIQMSRARSSTFKMGEPIQKRKVLAFCLPVRYLYASHKQEYSTSYCTGTSSSQSPLGRSQTSTYRYRTVSICTSTMIRPRSYRMVAFLFNKA
jgi:hypothetical protein